MTQKPHFGILNHNPGNIRWNSHDKWQGLAPNPRYVPDWDSTGIGFFRFTAPEWGIRAVAKTLLTYRSKYGDDTLQELFSRYAPTGDHANDPHAYAVFVGKQIGAEPNEAVDLSDRTVMRALLSAIFKMELGYDPQYTDAIYDKALDLAGFAHEVKPMPTHRPWWRFW